MINTLKLKEDELVHINQTIETYNQHKSCPDFVTLLACEINTIDRPELENYLVDLAIKANNGEHLEKIEA